MRNKSKLVIVVVILVVILSGCGWVPESEHKKLEEQVKALEEKLNKQVDSAEETNNGAISTPGVSPTATAIPEGVYDLSDRSVDQIVYEVADILSARLNGEDTEKQFIESLGLRFKPSYTQVNRRGGSVLISYGGKWDKDAITNIDFYFDLKDDGWNFDAEKSVRVGLKIFDAERAEMIYRKLEDRFFSGGRKIKREREWEANYPGNNMIRIRFGDNASYIEITMEVH